MHRRELLVRLAYGTAGAALMPLTFRASTAFGNPVSTDHKEFYPSKLRNVRIKPVFIGTIHDYPWLYPSKIPTEQEVSVASKEFMDSFQQRLNVDFVEFDPVLVIKEKMDFRRLKSEISLDTDAILIGSYEYAAMPEQHFLAGLGLPIIRRGFSSDGELSGTYLYECFPSRQQGTEVTAPELRGLYSVSFLRALRLKKFLSNSKFLYVGEFPAVSILNYPTELFYSEKRLGVRVKHVDTGEFFNIFHDVSDRDTENVLSLWRKDFDSIVEPTDTDLSEMTKGYLALRHLVLQEDANGIAVNCNNVWNKGGVSYVPCMAYNRLIDEGIMCSCEGDITGMISMLMLHAMDGQPVLIGNFGYRPGLFNAKEDEVTIQHGIIPKNMAMTGYKLRDYHQKGWGVTGYADIRREPMTIVSIDNSFTKMSVIEGYIKYSEDPEKTCRICIHMGVNGDVAKVPSIMAGSQHYSMTFGHWLQDLVEAGQMLGIQVMHL